MDTYIDWLKKNRVTAVAVIVMLGLIVFVSWPKSPPPSGTQTINEVKAALEKQYLDQIADYKRQLSSSELKYQTLAKKYNDLQRKKDDVKPPTTNAELRDRFTALGYPPLPSVK